MLLAIPLYSNAAGTIPIVQALLGKGMAVGTTLAFMMAITAISLPEFIILKKVIKTAADRRLRDDRDDRDPDDRLPLQLPHLLSGGALDVPFKSGGNARMKTIEVLGPGCNNCRRLEANAREAAALAGIDAEFVKVTDYGQIMAYGIMSTPGLVIDGKVVSYGRVPSAGDIAAWLAEA